MGTKSGISSSGARVEAALLLNIAHGSELRLFMEERAVKLWLRITALYTFVYIQLKLCTGRFLRWGCLGGEIACGDRFCHEAGTPPDLGRRVGVAG